MNIYFVLSRRNTKLVAFALKMHYRNLYVPEKKGHKKKKSKFILQSFN